MGGKILILILIWFAGNAYWYYSNFVQFMGKALESKVWIFSEKSDTFKIPKKYSCGFQTFPSIGVKLISHISQKKSVSMLI